jgi:hypothetical protein
MDWRIAEHQLAAAKELGTFTKQLVNATRVLWIATAALFAASVTQIIVMFVLAKK